MNSDDCTNYHVITTNLAFATPLEVLFKRNKNRKHQIPTSVIECQLTSIQWPSAYDAHRMITVT